MALRGRGLQFDDDEYKEKDYGKTGNSDINLRFCSRQKENKLRK